MNQTNTYYRVGPHVLRIGGAESLEPSALLPSFAPFVLSVEEGEKAAEVIEVDICPSEVAAVTDVEDTFPQPVSFEWENARCTLRRRADGSYRIGIAPLDNLAVEAYADCTDRFRRNVISLPVALHPMAPFVVNNFLMMIYTFATAERGTLMVHASVIRYEGRGYLFLGKSGTGKSTHTRLWLKHIEGSRLLNDDNPVVALDPKTGEATVYGTPWSGKTPCYKNLEFPVAGMVRLRQASANRFYRCEDVDAFIALLPGCSVINRDERLYSALCEILIRLCGEVQVGLLDCLPDSEAAFLCRNELNLFK